MLFFNSEHSSEGLSSFALHHRTCEIPNHLRIPGTMNVFDQSEGMVTHKNAHQFYFLDIVAIQALPTRLTILIHTEPTKKLAL